MSSPGYPLVMSNSRFCFLFFRVVLPLVFVAAPPANVNQITFETHSSPEAGTSGSATTWYKPRAILDLST